MSDAVLSGTRVYQGMQGKRKHRFHGHMGQRKEDKGQDKEQGKGKGKGKGLFYGQCGALSELVYEKEIQELLLQGHKMAQGCIPPTT